MGRLGAVGGGPWAALVLAALLLTACSSGDAARPGQGGAPLSSTGLSPPASPATTTPSPAATGLQPTGYESEALALGAVGLWPLRDVPAQMTLGQRVAGFGAGGAAVNVDGRIDGTDAPPQLGRGRAARFASAGRLVTGVADGLTSDRAFTVELWFRADDCTRSWGRIAGTETAGARGREGVNVFHYPAGTRRSCRLGVEVWDRDRFVVGCPEGAPAPDGVWQHVAVTWSQGDLSCYVGGRRVDGQRRPAAVFRQSAPFGIGATGTASGGILAAGSVAQVAIYGRALSPDELRRRALPTP
ncbi:MAG: Concanavalin A-like lectin/glucanase superfamily [Actinotalea sp.]|nr:Concanavalin A-like lectin/glucanase superfamily [Actinotalea sp.]